LLCDFSVASACFHFALRAFVLSCFRGEKKPMAPALLLAAEAGCGILETGMAILHQKVALIECGDDVTLEELRGGTPLPAHVMRQLSPRAAIVDPEYLDQIIQAMVQKGYTPRVSS